MQPAVKTLSESTNKTDEFNFIDQLRPTPQFRLQDCQEVQSTYHLADEQINVSFSEDKLTKSVYESNQQDLMYSTVSQRTELNVLKEKQFELLLKPVNFNILVAGQSGAGKTTFINTLFEQTCFQNKQTSVVPHQCLKVVENTAILSRKDIRLQLTLIDTEGYPSHSHIRQWLKKIKRVITAQLRIHQQKTRLCYTSKDLYQAQMKNISDDRIHACLYFINGPRMTQEDLFAMKNLAQVTNLIPLIAKGDAFTLDEQMLFKRIIKKSLIDYKIECYDCFKCLPENNKYKAWLIKQEAPPFIMISNISNNGEKGRCYPWGVCEVWNPEHSDLQTIQKLLIGYYSLDMIQLTDYYQHRYNKNKQERRQKRKQQKLQSEMEYPYGDIFKILIQGVIKYFTN